METDQSQGLQGQKGLPTQNYFILQFCNNTVTLFYLFNNYNIHAKLLQNNTVAEQSTDFVRTVKWLCDSVCDTCCRLLIPLHYDILNASYESIKLKVTESVLFLCSDLKVSDCQNLE